MQVLKKWLNLIMLLLWGQTLCRSQNAAIQHLNLKLDRLNRITNGLQRDVDDIWTALSNIVVVNSGKVNQGSNETEPRNSNPEEVFKLVNGAISDVEELKTEVKELVVYAQNGLKNEKAFSRNAIEEMSTSQNEFKAQIRKDIKDMKIWLENLEQTQKQTLEDNKILLGKMQNLTNDHRSKLAENRLEIQACNDKLKTVEQNFTSMKKHITDEVALVKQEIVEKLKEAFTGTCETGWESFGTDCYFISSEKLAWNEAWGFCRTRDSHLVEVDEKDKTDFLVQSCKALYEVWVGGNDRDKEGTFVWQTSKKTVPSVYFYPGEPNDSRGFENCALMYCQGVRVSKLNDYICEEKMNFICEKSKYIFQ